MTRMRLILLPLLILPFVSGVASANAASIIIGLTASKERVEVLSAPEGTAQVKVAYMAHQPPASGEVHYVYPNPSLTSLRATPYKPPAGFPVVDMQAASSTGAAIGNWYSTDHGGERMVTVPGGVTEETELERKEREQREREAKEKAEREAREKAEREQREREEAEHASPMVKSLDTGGWVGESIAQDFSHAVKYVRSGSYNSDASIGTLAKAGVQLMPLFNSWTASNVLAWFQRWGHGGSYWAGKTDLGATTCEVMNEPGNPYQNGERTTTDQPRYARTVEEYARVLSALPAANRPRLLVSMDGGFAGDEYGRILVKDDPNLTKLGLGWTVHPYGGKSSTRQHSAEGGRTRVTESFRPVYVTEVGWPTAVGQPPTGDSQQWSESEQAANIVNFVHWARALGYVNDVTVFNFVDYGTNDFYGIERKDRTHKLSFNALRDA